MDQNHIDKSDINIIQLNPEKSLQLRGNITVTPISVPKRAPISILPKKELDANISPMMLCDSLDIGIPSIKRTSIDSMNESLMLKNMFNQSEVICFEGNKLNEETTIVAVKSDVTPAKKTTNSSGFTSISSVPTVPSIIVPSAPPKAEGVYKVSKKSTKMQQGSKITGSVATNDFKPVQYKPIAPKSEERTSLQVVRPAKSIPSTKNAVTTRPIPNGTRPEKLSQNVTISPKDNCQMGNKLKTVQSSSQKGVSQAQVRRKSINTLSKMTTISPVGGPAHKQSNLVNSISKPQAPLKMSVTNGLLATLKTSMDVSSDLKPQENKPPMKRVSSSVTAPKSNESKQKYNLPLKTGVPGATKLILGPNGKSVPLKPSSNGVQQRAPTKLVKVKGSNMSKQTSHATNLSSNTSQSDKQQNSPAITEKPTLKSANKGHNGVSSSKLLKKKPGRPSQSLNFKTGSALDTELSFNQKQHAAHEILAQLLIVTSQLPMVKFSHALETIETLSDAFKLGHRVNMSLVRHEETNINDVEAFDVCYESDHEKVTSGSLNSTQLDGQLDADAMHKFFQSREGALSNMAVDDEVMEVPIVPEAEPVPPPEPQAIEDEPMEEVPTCKRTSSDDYPPQSPDSKKSKIA